jgi:hypothetical protein
MTKSGKKEIKNNPATQKTRSCGYPMFALNGAIEAAKTLCNSLGDGPHSRQAAARGLGYSSFSGAASAKIGSLVHFGLLARLAGSYSITPLAKTIFDYPAEGSEDAIVQAVRKPVLYNRLIARFCDKPIPEKLEAILAADYGITGKAAPVAAQNFIQTLEFAGLLRDGTLVFPQREEQDGPLKTKKKNDAGINTVKISLPSGVMVVFPQELGWRLSMGEFGDELKSLENKTKGKFGFIGPSD